VKPLPVLALVLVLVACGASTEDQVQRDGNSVVLPVVFPDGTEADLIYPAELDIAGLPVHPYSSGRLHGKSPNSLRGDVVGRDFWIERAKVHDVLVGANRGKEPRLVAEYRGADGQPVGLWDIRLDSDYLGFQFGSWAVLVYDYTDAAAMTEEERASWAASFSGRETKGGYLLLKGRAPLRLARAGEHAGPEIEFGESAEGKGLSLSPARCRQPVDRGPGHATWCVAPSMRAQAVGPERFVKALLAGLEVRDPSVTKPNR
jgi:hypothetical protein